MRLVGPIDPPVNPQYDEDFEVTRSLADQEYLIVKDGGEPRPYITVETIRQEMERISGVPQDLIEFIEYLLVIDRTKRPTAREALEHPYLAGLRTQ
jgi:serine/threonine protein kinase